MTRRTVVLCSLVLLACSAAGQDAAAPTAAPVAAAPGPGVNNGFRNGVNNHVTFIQSSDAHSQLVLSRPDAATVVATAAEPQAAKAEQMKAKAEQMLSLDGMNNGNSNQQAKVEQSGTSNGATGSGSYNGNNNTGSGNGNGNGDNNSVVYVVNQQSNCCPACQYYDPNARLCLTAAGCTNNTPNTPSTPGTPPSVPPPLNGGGSVGRRLLVRPPSSPA